MWNEHSSWHSGALTSKHYLHHNDKANMLMLKCMFTMFMFLD